MDRKDVFDSDQITNELKTALEELFTETDLAAQQIFVVGCSTSEVIGARIGTHSSLEVARAIWDVLSDLIIDKGIYLAIQCCEHINRALVVEKACQEKYNLEEVTVYPMQKAGGSLAYLAMKKFREPVVVETIQAHAGIDIGGTMIGMHLKPVAVPVRKNQTKIGQAHLAMARTRPKLIGGERACYEGK